MVTSKALAETNLTKLNVGDVLKFVEVLTENGPQATQIIKISSRKKNKISTQKGRQDWRPFCVG